MPHRRRFLVPVVHAACLSVVSMSPSAWGMTVSTKAQCNLFVNAAPLEFVIDDVDGDAAQYTLRDYDGQTVAEGRVVVRNGRAELTLTSPGPGWFRLQCRSGDTRAQTTLGVVLDDYGAPITAEDAVGVDAMGAAGKYYAPLLADMGVGWARERLWMRAVFREERHWDSHVRKGKQLISRGIRTSLVWSDTQHPVITPGYPRWVFSDDLRDVFRFAQRAGNTLKGIVRAHEIENEPDWGYWMPDQYAGFLKAAYLGLKDADPDILVLNASLGNGATVFARTIYECGAGTYSDVFNWHFYGPAEEIAGNFEVYRRILEANGQADRPAWITEGQADPRPSTEGPDKSILSFAHQQIQARNIPRSIVMARAAGVARYFHFSLQHRAETIHGRRIQFGLTYPSPEQNPYPGLVSLSAAANILGDADYLGSCRLGRPDAAAHAFATPRGNVIVAWARQAGKASWSTPKPSIVVADMFGAPSVRTVRNGRLDFDIGPDPVYLLDVGECHEAVTSRPPARRTATRPAASPARVVIVGYGRTPPVGEIGNICYGVAAHEVFDFSVEVYNFHEDKTVEGVVRLSVPDRWRADVDQWSWRLRPLERQAATVKIRPGAPAPGVFKVRLEGAFPGRAVSPSVSCFRFADQQAK